MMEPPSFSGSSKRAKAPGNMAQVTHCLVDGCNADLSLCREYHRRHKVCEAHSKTPKVIIMGREQRFCQQCSRFHSLVEFDEGKRSCRKRLDGHNRRRRKPQPDALARNSGLVFSTRNQTMAAAGATRLLSFTNPQMLPAAVVGSTWPPGIVKQEHEIPLYNSNNYLDSRPNSFPESSSQLQFTPGNAVSGSSSNRALSLLSSVGPLLTEFCQTDEAPLPSLAQPLPHHLNLQYNDELELGKYPVGKSKAPGSGRGLHLSEEMFQQQQEGAPSTSGPHQTLSFMWE